MNRPHEVELWGDDEGTIRPETGATLENVYVQLNVDVSETTSFENTTGQEVQITINNNTGEGSIQMGSFRIGVTRQPPVVFSKRIYRLLNTSQTAQTLPEGMDFSFGNLVE